MSLIPSFLPLLGEACDGYLVHLFNRYSLLTVPGLGVRGYRDDILCPEVVTSNRGGTQTVRVQCDWSWGLKGNFGSLKAGCQIHSGKTRKYFPKVASNLRIGHESEQHVEEEWGRMAEASPLPWHVWGGYAGYDSEGL